MKRAVFLIGTLSNTARLGDAISAADFAVLENTAEKANVDAKIVFCVTDVACAGKAAKATMGKIRVERDRVLKEVRGHKPDLIMAFGPVAAKTVFNKGNVVLKESLRQEFDLDEWPAPVYVTQSLDMVAAKPGAEKWLALDVRAASEGFTETKWGNYKVLMPGTVEWDECPRWLRDKSPGTVFGFDLETYPGLDPWAPDSRIRMAMVSDQVGRCITVQLGPDSRLPDWLRRIVETKLIIKAGSNIKFDYKWLRRFGVRMCSMHDTSTAEHVIDETNPMKDLKSLTFLYLPRLGDYSKAHRMLVAERGGWEYVDDDEQYQYAGADGEASLAAALVQRKKLFTLAMERPFKLSMDLYAALAEIEHNGCRVSMKANAELDEGFQASLLELRTEIVKELGPINPGSTQQLAKALKEAVPNIDLTKAQLVRQFLGQGYRLHNAEDEDQISTDRATLEREAEKHPIIEKILVWRRLSKLHSTYIKGVQEKHKTERGGKTYLSTSFRTDVVETYRLSSQAPNLQNIPRKPSAEDKHPIPLELNVKRQYISRFEGGVFMEGDLAQAEVRGSAMLSGDRLLLDAINSDEDLHTSMAAIMLDKSVDDVTHEERHRCKKLTFLILYGGGANTLGRQLGISKNAAKDLIVQYFQTFKQLDFYINRVKMNVKRDLSAVSVFGYKRHFRKPPNWNSWDGWRVERQAWNFQVQNMAACIAFVALIDLQNTFERCGLESKIVLQVHDSIGVDVHPDEIHTVATLLRKCLSKPNTKAYGVEITVPLEADVEYGPSWGEMKPYDFEIPSNDGFVIASRVRGGR